METKQFYNSVAKTYHTEHSATIEWAEELKAFISHLVSPERLIIDLGCGSGIETYWFSQHLQDKEIIGVDFSENMIDVAQSNYVSQNLHFQVEDSMAYIPPNPVSAIWARASFHHLTKDQLQTLFSHINTYLSPDGLLTMINKYGTGEEYEKKEKYGRVSTRYFQYFNEDLVQKLIQSTELHIFNQYQKEKDNTQWLVTFLRKQ